nr:hypothetical protein [bacterium]
MRDLSEKELAGLHDMLDSEGLLIKKFQLLSDMATDADIKGRLQGIVAIHQSHYNRLFQQLN